jgi:DNA-directed RNA polymerase subunit M/transcription elongation factor TFIIS
VGPVIFFFCPECKEELEAEDSIRGTRMKCPACAKEIEVPQASVKVTTRVGRKPGEGGEREAPEEAHPGARFILVVLLAGFAGILALGGVGYTLLKRERERAERARPRCASCEGTGKVKCAVCSGRKVLPCKECSGTGRRKNFRDQDEDCFACRAGFLDCLICAGRGEYGCSGCGGTGRLGP